MARWKLTEAHYLNVPNTQTEQLEISPEGRASMKRSDVHRYLDPRYTDDWNYRLNAWEGDIIVCWPGKGEPRDIPFIGQPTPGMLPLDDEAKAESAKYDWTPTRSTNDADQADSYYRLLEIQLATRFDELRSSVQQAPQAAGMDKMMEVMMQMMAQQTQILAAIAGRMNPEVELARQAAALGEKPVVLEEEPLGEVEPTAQEIAAAEQAAVAREAERLAKRNDVLRSGRRL